MLIVEERMPAQTEPAQELPEEMQAECAENNVPDERCQQWSAKRSAADECRQAGIITREECAAYMKQRHLERLPGCAAGDATACAAEITEKTAGLMPSQELDRLNETVVPMAGKSFRMKKTAAAAEAPPLIEAPPPAEPELAAPRPPVEAFDETLVKNVPFKRDRDLTIKVHASPAFAKLDETTSRKPSPRCCSSIPTPTACRTTPKGGSRRTRRTRIPMTTATTT